MTKQAFAKECDINNIMKNFERTGALTHANQYEGNYGDFLDVPTSYHEAENQIIAAQEMFLTVPSKIRAQFENDPQQFLDFVEDPANEPQMREMGLLPPSTSQTAVDGAEGPLTPPRGPSTPSEAQTPPTATSAAPAAPPSDV